MSQIKPREKCVCGKEFEHVGNYWQCGSKNNEDAHIFSGPLDDPTGEKIDAMIRGMRTRPTMTLAEIDDRMARIGRAQADINRLNHEDMREWQIKTPKGTWCLQILLDLGLFQMAIGGYIEQMRQVIADECAALGVEEES